MSATIFPKVDFNALKTALIEITQKKLGMTTVMHDDGQLQVFYRW